MHQFQNLPQFDNETVNAVNDIKTTVTERNLEIFNIHNLNFINSSEKQNKGDREEGPALVYVSNDDFFDSIKKNSLYTIYYSNFIKRLEIQTSSIKSNVRNHFYRPELFDLLKAKLHLMPLWTAILLRQGQDNLKARNLLGSDASFLEITRLTILKKTIFLLCLLHYF